MKHISEIIEEYMKELNDKRQPKENRLYESVNNYTKYKLVEMLINKHKEDKLNNLNNINAIEDLAESVLNVLHLCGMKYYQELNTNFDKDGK